MKPKYYYLKDGDTIQATDEERHVHHSEFKPVASCNIGNRVMPAGVGLFRRRIEADTEQGKLF